MNNFKSDKFVEVLQEFLIVQGQNTYSIGSMSLSDVYFFVKKGNENYKVLATGQYRVVGTNLIIDDASVITNNTNIQVCKVLNIVASKYISDIANINTLRDHYNTLVDDFIKIIDFLRKSGIKSDSSSMNYIFPLLEEGQVFMKKGIGFEGKQIMDIDAELQAQIDKAYAFFEDYVNKQKKPELDAYTVAKKQELETYTISKKGEINTLTTASKNEINTLSDTKKTEIIELGNSKQQEIINLTTGKIKEITDLTTVKKQEIETLTVQKKVEMTNHADYEISRIDSAGVAGLQTQINQNKSDILLKLDKSGGTLSGNLTAPAMVIGGEYHIDFNNTPDYQLINFRNPNQEIADSFIGIFGSNENSLRYRYDNPNLSGKTDYLEGNIFHTGNCPISKSTNGWCKLANGLIVQWGLFVPRVVGQIVYNEIKMPISFSSKPKVIGDCIPSYGISRQAVWSETVDSLCYSTEFLSTITWIAIGW